MRFFTILAIVAGLNTPAFGQSLEQQEKLNQLEKTLDTLNDLSALTEKMTKEKKQQCISAIANEVFCECISLSLPVVINFVNYVSIITQTKAELGYDRDTKENKALIDNTRSAREKCVRARR